MRVICEQEELWREINPCEHLDKGVVCYRRISSYLISQARFIAPGSGKVPLNADCWNIKGSNFKRQVEVFVYLLQIELEWKMNNSISGVACDVTDLVNSEITGMGIHALVPIVPCDYWIQYSHTGQYNNDITVSLNLK